MSSELSEERHNESAEDISTEERLKRVEEAIAQFNPKQKQISRNTLALTVVRYTLVMSLGTIGLIAAILSGANYERKIGDSSISFNGAEFKGALQIIAGIAATGTGALGFGESFIQNFIKKGDKED